MENLYKSLDAYQACAIVEGFSGEEHTQEEILTAWQWIHDHGLSASLQGWYGRTEHALLEAGYIHA